MAYYGTEAGFTEYHKDRGADVSVHSSENVLSALLVASEWLDGSFRSQFQKFGYKIGQRAQMREWPRTEFVDGYGYAITAGTIPTEVEYATYEAALRYLNDPSALNADYTPNKYESVTIDGALSVKYRQLNAATVQQQFPKIGQILDGLIGDHNDSSIVGTLTRI